MRYISLTSGTGVRRGAKRAFPLEIWTRNFQSALWTCICIETWKGQAKYRCLSPWKNFCGRPWRLGA